MSDPVRPKVLSLEEKDQWAVFGQFDDPPRHETLAVSPQKPGTLCYLMCGTEWPPSGQSFILVYEAKVVGISKINKRKVHPPAAA